MSQTEQNQNTIDDPFYLTVDQYGHLWLNAKIEGVPVAIDLAEKDIAFAIMAATMSDNDFEYRSVHQHEAADNDDQRRK
ncbi:MAG: hypothetical protein H0U53_02710 [Actinobacteria bacterium]|nr:hypothetical protein [Actinomycetota bacterium]